MPCFSVKENMIVEPECNLFESDKNEKFKEVCVSLLIIKNQVSEFKTSLISAKNFVKLSGIIIFEEKVQKLLSEFCCENIEPNDLNGQRNRSISSRLNAVLEAIGQIKKNIPISEINGQIDKMDDMEKEIKMLILMLASSQ